jgi:FKBP-type peptidyl-prolyl cis-trans isomerase
LRAVTLQKIKLPILQMKKTIVLGVGCVLALGATAQAPKKAPVKPVAKSTTATKTAAKPATAVVLKNSLDSLSYAIGVLDASFFKQQGIEKLNYNVMMQAVQSVIEGKEPLLSPQVADQTMRQKMQEAAQQKIVPQVEEGKKFCAANKKRPEVTETASGLQYEVIKEGTGAKPKDTSVVKVHYVGSLLNGTKFDSSRDRGEPAQFPLNGVIRGWTEGVQLMPVGSIYKFYIPYDLAYGAQGSPPVIPGGATLVFEVELLDIVSNSSAGQ